MKKLKTGNVKSSRAKMPLCMVYDRGHAIIDRYGLVWTEAKPRSILGTSRYGNQHCPKHKVHITVLLFYIIIPQKQIVMDQSIICHIDLLSSDDELLPRTVIGQLRK